MKIILSRKGFDSGHGGQASPILPDGKLLSLPIPSPHGEKTMYAGLQCNGKTYFDIIHELNPNTKRTEIGTCHADPDMCRGLFGQHDSSQGHLHKHKVGKGDIFLFFGWFRQSMIVNKKLTYAEPAKGRHILFGYLQVGRMYSNTDIVKNNIPQKIQCHPHRLSHYTGNSNNCIYEASEKLTLDESLPGYGVFTYHESLALTKKGEPRSHWELPDFFNKVNITYHSNTSFKNGYFQAASRGQEFVIDCNDTAVKQQVTQWALDKINNPAAEQRGMLVL
ncbi:MAG: hypothetical protein Pg6C_11750 [Treponemataceae bacterium]|nr:MAG: hypothetical protein Pg6C_11750 [Treponemataceae bacterium]